MIQFDQNTGYLPPGIHVTDWQEVDRLCGFNDHRKAQLEGLKRAIHELKRAGCQTLYLDGSFTTHKRFPGDYDAAYDATGMNGSILVKHAPELLDFFQLDRNGIPKGIIQMDLKVMV